MTSQQTPVSKKRGPKPTGWGTPIMVRLRPEQLAALDEWIASQARKPSRPEAIRILLAEALPTPNTTPVPNQFEHGPGSI